MARPTHPLLLITFAATLFLRPQPAAATEYPDGFSHRWNITFAEYLRDFFTWFAILAPPPILVSLFFRRELQKTRAYQRSLAEVSVATAVYILLAFLWTIFVPSGRHPLIASTLGGGFGWSLGTSVGLSLLTMPAIPLLITRTKRLLRTAHLSTSNKPGFEPILPNNPPRATPAELPPHPDLP